MATGPSNNIIEVPSYPRSSLGLKLSVSQGRNQIQRNVGNYNALFMTEGLMTDSLAELVEDQVLQSPFNQFTDVFVLSVTAPVTLAIITEDDSELEVVVQKLFVADYVIKSYSITAHASTRVYINAISKLNLPA